MNKRGLLGISVIVGAVLLLAIVGFFYLDDFFSDTFNGITGGVVNVDNACANGDIYYSYRAPVEGGKCCWNGQEVNSGSIAGEDSWDRYFCYNGQLYTYKHYEDDLSHQDHFNNGGWGINSGACSVVGDYFANPEIDFSTTTPSADKKGWIEGNGLGVRCGENSYCNGYGECKPNIVRNGGFDGDGNWTLTNASGRVWVYRDELVINKYGYAVQNFSAVLGKKYRLSVDGRKNGDDITGLVTAKTLEYGWIGGVPIATSQGRVGFNFEVPSNGDYLVTLETTPEDADKNLYTYFDDVYLFEINESKIPRLRSCNSVNDCVANFTCSSNNICVPITSSNSGRVVNLTRVEFIFNDCQDVRLRCHTNESNNNVYPFVSFPFSESQWNPVGEVGTNDWVHEFQFNPGTLNGTYDVGCYLDGSSPGSDLLRVSNLDDYPATAVIVFNRTLTQCLSEDGEEDICSVRDPISGDEDKYDLGDTHTFYNSTGGSGKYFCDEDGEWTRQRDNGDSCDENYECLSVICSSGRCSAEGATSTTCTYQGTNYDIGDRFGSRYCSALGSVVSQKARGYQCSNDYECSSNNCNVLCQEVNSSTQNNTSRQGNLGDVDDDNDADDGAPENRGIVIFWTIFILVILLGIIVSFVIWSAYQKKHFDDKKKPEKSHRPGPPGRPPMGSAPPGRPPQRPLRK